MSQYDLKIIKFDNGDVEFRLYDKVICELTAEEKRIRLRKRLETLENRKLERDEDLEYCYEYLEENPFDSDVLKVLDIDKYSHYEILQDLRKSKNLKDSRRRTVQKIHDISRSCKWTKFYTLTFSPEVIDRSDFDSCMKKANKWFDHLRRYAPNLKYLFVPELHADKINWHIHGLVCDDDGVLYSDSGKKDKSGRTIYNISGWHFGWSTATDITDSLKASSYILKYITKDVCEHSLVKRRYYHSRNIPKPIVSEIDVSDFVEKTPNSAERQAVLQTIIDSMGADVSRRKKVVTEHCSVEYINAHIESEE